MEVLEVLNSLSSFPTPFHNSQTAPSTVIMIWSFVAIFLCKAIGNGSGIAPADRIRARKLLINLSQHLQSTSLSPLHGVAAISRSIDHMLTSAFAKTVELINNRRRYPRDGI